MKRPVKAFPETGSNGARKYGAIKSPDVRQLSALHYYYDPDSPTHLNKTRSAIRAGFGKKYAERVLVVKPKVMQQAAREIEAAYLSKEISSEVLAQRHRQLLMKDEMRWNMSTMNWEAIPGRPDTNAVGKALELAYRVRGDFAPEKHLHVTTTLGEILDEIQGHDQPLVRARRDSPTIGGSGVAAE